MSHGVEDTQAVTLSASLSPYDSSVQRKICTTLFSTFM